MASAKPNVRLGVGVFILQSRHEPSGNPRFLMGKRINSHGSGTYALPGGHLEFGETLEECAAREVLEETGLKVTGIQFFTATNDIMKEDNKHYVTMFMVCVRENDKDVAEVLEIEKCEGWVWVAWEELVELVKIQDNAKEGEILERKLFIPMLNLVKQRAGMIPSFS